MPWLVITTDFALSHYEDTQLWDCPDNWVQMLSSTGLCLSHMKNIQVRGLTSVRCVHSRQEIISFSLQDFDTNIVSSSEAPLFFILRFSSILFARCEFFKNVPVLFHMSSLRWSIWTFYSGACLEKLSKMSRATDSDIYVLSIQALCHNFRRMSRVQCTSESSDSFMLGTHNITGFCANYKELHRK